MNAEPTHVGRRRRRPVEAATAGIPGRPPDAITVEPLEGRTLFSTITVTDLESPDDGLQDLVISGASNDPNSDVIVYVDYANDRTVIFDDLNGNFAASGGVNASITASPPDTTVTTVAGGPEVYVLPFVPETINAFLGSGDDVLSIQFVSDFGPATIPSDPNGMSVYAQMGNNNDTFKVSSPTSLNNSATSVNNALVAAALAPLTVPLSGAEIDRSDVLIDADGGPGNDVLNADLSRTSVTSSNVVVEMTGGSGADTINFATPDRLFGESGLIASAGGPSRVSAKLYTGGTGTDALPNTVNLNVRPTISSASNLDVDIEGDAGVDTVNANNANAATKPFDFNVFADGRLTLDAVLYNGNDKFLALYDFGNPIAGPAPAGGGPGTQAITAPGITTAAGTLAHFGVSGGFGDDTIDLRTSAAAGSTSAPIGGTLEFDLRGGDGKDVVLTQFDSPTAQADNYLFFTADSLFNVFLYGDGGDDKILELDFNLDGVTTLDLAIYAGSGNDRASLSTDVTLGFLGFVRGLRLDGGAGGADRYDIDGNVSAFFAAPFGNVAVRGFEVEDDTIESNEVVI